MKNFMLFLAIIMLMMAGCSKSANPVSADNSNGAKSTPVPDIVFTGTDTITYMPGDCQVAREGFQVDIMGLDQGTEFRFLVPKGGKRIFTGDSAKLFTGKYTEINCGVIITCNGTPQWLNIVPSTYYIDSLGILTPQGHPEISPHNINVNFVVNVVH